MESLIPPFDAYKGDAPYIFVSYAHKNSDVVFAHITRLYNEGFRIWYDEGIDPGADWSDEIASALANAAIFLVFISDAAVASHNVRKEIVFAIDQRKYMVCVHVEETQLPVGLQMQLGNLQALLETRFHDKEKFYSRLFTSLLPETTSGEEPVALPIKKIASSTGGSFKETDAGKATQGFYKKALLGLIAAILLGAAVLGCVAFIKNDNSSLKFADQNLESALRQEMQRPKGSVSEEDLATFRGKLDLSGKGITDITPLRFMTGLVVLNIENNTIVDITALEGMKGLTVLGIANNKISDLSPLRGLGQSLLGLSVEGNPITDLKQLRPLSNLEVLDLSGVPITDLELGKYLRRLKKVIITENGHGLSPEDLRRFKADLPPNCDVAID